MRKPILPPIKTALISACFLLFASGLHASTPPSTKAGEVLLTGWLHAEDHWMADVLVTVEVDGMYARQATVAPNGRFMVALPAGADALLRFEKPGHVTKEVKVDTRDALAGKHATYKARKVQFAVVLDPMRTMAGLTYAGPVGSIAFDPALGDVAVAHYRTLLPAPRTVPIEF